MGLCIESISAHSGDLTFSATGIQVRWPYSYFSGAFDSSWRHCSSWLYRTQEFASLDQQATLLHIQLSASDKQEHFSRHWVAVGQRSFLGGRSESKFDLIDWCRTAIRKRSLFFVDFSFLYWRVTGPRVAKFPVYCITYYLKSLFQNFTQSKELELYDSFQPLLKSKLISISNSSNFFKIRGDSG